VGYLQRGWPKGKTVGQRDMLHLLQIKILTTLGIRGK